MEFQTKPEWSYQALPVAACVLLADLEVVVPVASSPPKSSATASRSLGRPAASNSVPL